MAPPPTAADSPSAALDTLLDAVDVRIRGQRRVRLDDGEMLVLPQSSLSFAYVITGNTTTRVPVKGPHQLGSGEVLLSSGRLPATLTADGPASVLLTELELAEQSAHLLALLPDAATIAEFAALEPGAAALAQHMGVGAHDEHAKRGGDLAICRMMAKTVLASVIRAWVAKGCAPTGWPASASDPFLDRVINAIHAEPGRDWTVETLASLGAMSRSVFAERFRSTFGNSPAGYVTAVRMRAAQDLLTRGLGVSAVSRELGYASDEGFSRAFRRHVGTTPSTWRAQHQLTSA
ncbi:helix-turn-helix domain-containing protein [Microbacterium alcoholitolerans]|uniref:helix-turn-helix domain-containing protein n=1 Tax=unclassified Microbacterium TaxID=2609290 RepID=UPI003D16C8ED